MTKTSKTTDEVQSPKARELERDTRPKEMPAFSPQAHIGRGVSSQVAQIELLTKVDKSIARAFVSQIGRIHGNRNLQRMLSELKSPPKTEGSARWSRSGESKEVEIPQLLYDRDSERESPEYGSVRRQTSSSSDIQAKQRRATMVAPVHATQPSSPVHLKRPENVIQRLFRETQVSHVDGHYLVELDVDRTEFLLRVTSVNSPGNPPGAQFGLVRALTGLRGNVLTYQEDTTINDTAIIPMTQRRASVFTLHRDLGRGEDAIHNQGVLERLGLVPPDWLHLSSTTRTALEGRLGRWILWSVIDLVNACNRERRRLEAERARARELTGFLLDLAFVFVLPGIGGRIAAAFRGLRDPAISSLSQHAVHYGERIAATIGHVSKQAIQGRVESTIRSQSGEDLITGLRTAFTDQHRAIEGRIPTMSDQELVVLAGQYQTTSGSRESEYLRLLRVLLLAGAGAPRVRVAAGMSIVRLVRQGHLPMAIGIAQLNAMLRDREEMVTIAGRAGLQQLTNTEVPERYVRLCQFLSNGSERVRLQAIISLNRLATTRAVDRSLVRQQIEFLTGDSDRMVRQTAHRLAQGL